MTIKALGWTFLSAAIILTIFCLLLAAESPAHAVTHQCHGILGLASWYGSESGSRTANGERFNPNGLTIAMRSRDFGRRYVATFGGRSVVVRLTDYGPAAWTGRQVDVSREVASRLNFLRRGTARICLTPVARAPPRG